MTNADRDLFRKLFAEMYSEFGAQAPKASNRRGRKSKATRQAESLADKDASLLRGFARKGIKGVVLMDRTDKSKEFNVRSYNGWQAVGRQVRKGEKSVRGLFHISQTDVIVAPTQPQAETAQPSA